MLNDLQIDQLAKHFGGTSTPEEKREIIRWCKQNPVHERLYVELREVWKITGKIPTDFEPNVKVAWENVSTKIDSYEKVVEKSTGLKTMTYYITRVAAVFVVGLALYFMFELNNSNLEIYLSEQLVSETDVTDMLFVDGSRVWLNSNSVLKYSKSFDGDERLVELEGEAYFEIAKNPNKPFIIKTKNSVTKVLGTSFNISAYKNAENDIISVNSGIVIFSDSDNENNHVILLKGEKAELNISDRCISKSINSNPNYLSWKTGKLTFENETFDKLVDDLSKYYKRSFEISNHSLKTTRLTVTFDNQSLEDVLKVLELTLGATCSDNSKKVIIN